MIAYGCSITVPETYERAAGKGIARAATERDAVFADSAAGTLYRAYNRILKEVARLPELEALVLLHQDAEIVAEDFGARVRAALAGSDVALAGAVGARGSSPAWWEGAATWEAYVASHVEEPGVGAPGIPARTAPLGDVDTLDGFVLVLSPWAVGHLGFDEDLGLLVDGFDADLCRQARTAGRRVIAADLGVRHHHPPEILTDAARWRDSHAVLAEKWEAGDAEPDWRRRARRAEAEAEAAGMVRASRELQANVHARESAARLAVVHDSPSWRATEPLRRLNAWRRARRA